MVNTLRTKPKKTSDGGAGAIVVSVCGIKQMSECLTPGVTENEVSHCERKETQM